MNLSIARPIGVFKREIISKDSAAHPWVFACTESYCYFSVSALSFEDAKQKEHRHNKQGNCPFRGMTHIGGMMTLTLVEQMWERMDITYLELKAHEAAFGSSDVDTARLRGKLRGMAEMTAIFMPPHFRTPDEVAREVNLRWKKKQDGEEYETPGLGTRRYEPIPNLEYIGKRGGRAVTPKPVVNAELPLVKISDQEVQQIRFAMSSGAFTAEQLASTYKVTALQIAEIAAD